MKWISGKTVVVTGASSGIGRELTIKLIKEYSCNVIGVGRSKPKMESLKSELSYYSDNFKYHLFDVSKEKNWILFADYLKKHDVQVDILINNAGVMPEIKRFEMYTDEEIERVMKINFYSCVYSVRHLKENMDEAFMPAIINISSMEAISPLAGSSIYGVSKAAVKNYTECLIAELGRQMHIGIIIPGFTKTDIYRNQEGKMDSFWIRLLRTRSDKMANRIIKAIIKRKSKKVIGKDAKILNFFSKVCPIKSIKFCEIIIRGSKAKLFKNVFPY